MKPEELFSAPKKPGIYYFRNKLNGKYYIGQAEDLRRRLRKHVSNFKHEACDNPIYRALKKYGWENFEWGIFEVYEEGYSEEVDKKLDEAEMFYIKQYNSYGKTGYNQTLGGDGGIKGYKYTKEQREKVSNCSKSVTRDGRYKIFYFDIETKEYGEDLTLTDFLEKIKVTTRHIECLIANRYVVARSKEDLENKIQEYYKRAADTNKFKTGVSKLTEEMIIDIKNDICEKDFCRKYNVCRKTFNNYKHKIFDEMGIKYERVYDYKVPLEDYKEYRKSHNRKETAKYFNISVWTTYDYDKRINA